MEYFRSKYIDNHNTPLFRGVLHYIFTTIMTYFIPYMYTILSFPNFFAYMLIYSSYFFSTVYHCIKVSEKYENIIRKMDHIAIHNHIFGSCIIFCSNNIYTYILSSIFVMNYIIDSYNCSKSNRYLATTQHNNHYIISSIIPVLFLLVYLCENHFTQIVPIIPICYVTTGLIYVKGQKYFYSKQISNYNNIWSHHETFHIYIILASSIVIYCLLFV